MDFSLRYKGPLPANSGPREKHSIRRAFHSQLRAFWNEHPLLIGASTIPLIGLREPTGACDEADLGSPFVSATRTEWIASEHRRGAFYFTPLVTKELDLICSLDIQFFRREAPGGLIQQGGDIDNRIKTLFDALRVPDEEQAYRERPTDVALTINVRIATTLVSESDAFSRLKSAPRLSK